VAQPETTQSHLASVTGLCPVCGAPLKWAEIRKTRDEDGVTHVERWLVCQDNHRTPESAPNPPS